MDLVPQVDWKPSSSSLITYETCHCSEGLGTGKNHAIIKSRCAIPNSFTVSLQLTGKMHSMCSSSGLRSGTNMESTLSPIFVTFVLVARVGDRAHGIQIAKKRWERLRKLTIISFYVLPLTRMALWDGYICWKITFYGKQWYNGVFISPSSTNGRVHIHTLSNMSFLTVASGWAFLGRNDCDQITLIAFREKSGTLEMGGEGC